MKYKSLLLPFLAYLTILTSDAQSLWKVTSLFDQQKSGPASTPTWTYIPLEIRIAEMRAMLQNAPLETSQSMNQPETGVAISLPVSTGNSEVFGVFSYSMMEPQLATQFPEIKTYIARGIRNKQLFARLDVTEKGFHAMIYGGEKTMYIDPWNAGSGSLYQLYSKADVDPVLKGAFQEFEGDDHQEKSSGSSTTVFASGSQLRRYRLALAATGEYTAFHGGAVSQALSAMVTTMNRVNGIFEKEVSVRMVLVSNNSSIIYSNAATDPYTNGNASAMISENQLNITNVIGSANYDIGHVFGTNSGGLAALNSVCNASSKASGITGGSSPVGDAFDVDYVAHEIGHQFGAHHTFNSVTSSCSGNRTSSAAYEPGSGTTIMAYAGICSADNIQSNSDAYFHFHSYNQIIAFTTTGTGNSCAVVTSTGNTAPTAIAPTGGFTIPKSTPFKLSAVASDINGDAVRYCWEESDLGPSGAPNSPSGNAPVFRSFSPVTAPTRYFPAMSDVLNGTQTKGEILPSYGRNLSFKLTTRDNRAGGGGVNQASVSFSVSDTIGPFKITSPNVAGALWVAGNIRTIDWDVAKTNKAPVNCTHVNIWFSVDGGQNFNVPLVMNTPNDGRQDFIVPNTPTTQGRVMVEAVGNIFFSVNKINIQLQVASGVVATPVITPGTTTFNTALNVVMSCATQGAVIYYSTNGNTPVPNTTFTKKYTGPFAIFSSTTVRAIAHRQSFSTSSVSVAYYTLNNPTTQVATPVIAPGSGTFATAQTVTITSPTPGSVIYYTANGNVPVIGTNYTMQYTGSFIVPGTTAVRAMAVKGGMSASGIAVAFYTIVTPSQVLAPVISPATGTYSGPVSLVITSTPGASIFYTTNGNEPVVGTTFTKLYTGPVTLLSSSTIRAFATKPNMVRSVVTVSNITINNSPILATPVISPGSGTFSSPQVVSITCATPGVKIYYTTTGNTPVLGTGFTKEYVAPFQINATSSIKAIAMKTGSANSAVASSFITITGAPARLSTEDSGNQLEKLEVQPNPTSGKALIKWTGSGTDGTLLKVFNTLGAEVQTILVASGATEYNLDITNVKPGIYFIKTDQNPKMVRIIKQ